MPRPPWEISRDMFLSVDEVRRLEAHLDRAVARADGRDAVTSQLDRIIVSSLLYSGLRTSEFCRLRLQDVRIRKGGGSFQVAAMGKNGRTVFIPTRTAELAHKYIVEIRPGFLPPNASRTDGKLAFVFNEHRSPYERTALYRRVVRVLSEAGLADRASVQLLRHTYGYLAYLRTGGNLLFVQRQLGHAHPMISSIYAQFVNETYDDLANRVGAE